MRVRNRNSTAQDTGRQAARRTLSASGQQVTEGTPNSMNHQFRAGTAVAALPRVMPIPALLHRPSEILRGYFGGVTHPLNLAVTRILVFVICLNALNIDEILWFSGLPVALQFPPKTLAWLAPHIPINPQFASVAIAVFVVGSICGILGLFTRWAALAVVVSGLYALGIPQLYGKVDHYHHVLWFASILAFSPCSDAFSLDAIRRAWSAARLNAVPIARAPALAYALPLRFIWILMGIIYFFPGMWKARLSGLDWAIGPGFTNILYQKWFELGWWLPVIRVDQFPPVLLTMMALGTIVFELSFVFLIFSAKTRAIAAAAGTVFHYMTNVFLNIWFWDLNLMYLTFFDVERLCRWIGAKLFPRMMYVLFDGSCVPCRRMISCLGVVDILGRVAYVNASDESELRRAGFGHMDQHVLLSDMHVVLGDKTWRGFEAYRAWATRLPLLWPAVPLAALPPISAVGAFVYRRSVANRRCPLGAPGGTTPAVSAGTPRAGQVLVAVGTLLILSNAVAGFKNTTSWPFSVYPTFAPTPPPTTTVITMELTGPDGRLDSLTMGQENAALPTGSDRLRGLVEAVASMPDKTKQQEALGALMTAYEQVSPDISGASSIRFFRDEFKVAPETKGQPPVRHDVLFQITR